MLPVPMRVAPTSFETSAGSAAWTGSIVQGTNVFTTNDVYFFAAGTNFGFTTINTVNSTATPNMYITISLGNGTAVGVSALLTGGQAGTVYIPNTAGKFLGINAEL